MLICTCDICGANIPIPDECILGDNEVIRPRLFLEYANKKVFNKDVCNDCFYNFWDEITKRLKD